MPPNVEAEGRVKLAAMMSVEANAATGTPLPSAFAMVTMSGVTPQRSMANMRPVRPKPV
ncbi:hypothetical protein D3C73_1421130 [compost metagenome]